MFASAYSQAAGFTKPVIISHVRGDGKCFAGAGSYVVVNDEGWIVTAGHIFAEYGKLSAAKAAAKQHDVDRQAIEADKGLLADQKRKRLKQLGALDAKAAIDFSFWWGGLPDGVQATQVHGLKAADLAVAKLEPFDPAWVSSYPAFKDPKKPIASGTSLCRMGFPFHEIHPTYDKATGSFSLPPETFPMVFFPNEGILTRVIVVDQNAPVSSAFIETSSPGLMGQSGGPIFDQHGTVWGIQSHTSHLPLGFSPEVPGNPSQREHQFLNVGRGVHPATIVGLLDQLGVKFTLAAY